MVSKYFKLFCLLVVLIVVVSSVAYAFVYETKTQSVSQTILSSHVKAFISYRSNTGINLVNSPKASQWSGASWSSPGEELSSSGNSVIWVRVAFCPISLRYNEKIVVTLSSDAFLDAYVWDGSSWRVTNNIGQVNTAADTFQSFDLSYESTSGKAMLVYGVLSSNASRDLAYKIWNGTTWSGEAYIDDTGQSSHANYRWVELESNPVSGSNEIALIGVDQTNGHCNGWIWNGTAWGNFQELENSLASVRGDKCMGLAYEQVSGKAMFTWAYNTYARSRVWNGTNWENQLPDINIGTSNVRIFSVKADPASNQLMAITIDGGSNLNSLLWNGTAWGAPTIHDTSLNNPGTRSADFDWEPSGSKGLLVWSTAQDSVSYKTFAAPSSWSGAATVSNPGGHPWIQLRGNPKNVNGDVRIMGATLNSNQDLYGIRWNDTSLVFESTAFTSDTTLTSYECFDMAFQRARG
jgi:hypothetical protein